MPRHPAHRLLVAGLPLLAVLAAPAVAPAATRTPITGTIQLTAGKNATKAQQKKTRAKATGTYFRMILPGGTDRFFQNTNSRAKDKTYTLLRPGTDRGLRLGGFQEPPTPAFGPRGFALAKRITRPESFVGIDFSLSTAATDGQTGVSVPAPRLFRTGRKVTGDIRAWTATWNNIYFNQGAPKPNGTLPGFTKPVSGTYDPRTKKIEISWRSLIVGGPFNGFTGFWHLEGKVV